MWFLRYACRQTYRHADRNTILRTPAQRWSERRRGWWGRMMQSCFSCSSSKWHCCERHALDGDSSDVRIFLSPGICFRTSAPTGYGFGFTVRVKGKCHDRRPQTLPPVLPPGEFFLSLYMQGHYVQTRCHKYSTRPQWLSQHFAPLSGAE